MYGNYYPPPMMLPPQWGQHPDQQKYIEFGMKQAEKLMLREQREKERAEQKKRSLHDKERKDAEARRHRTLLSIEWYILGILCYPIWEPLYRAFTHYIQTVH